MVMALSAHTTASVQSLVQKSFLKQSLLYSNFGVAAGVLTVVSIPFM